MMLEQKVEMVPHMQISQSKVQSTYCSIHEFVGTCPDGKNDSKIYHVLIHSGSILVYLIIQGSRLLLTTV
jgi:hypothetical protein